MNVRRPIQFILAFALLAFTSTASAQVLRKVTVGWGDAMRLGRWTPFFITVENPVAISVDLQIHGTYGEKSLAFCVRQTAVAEPRPTTYGLLFPLNASPTRIEVIVSDEKTGQTLSTQTVQNPASFSPAGQVPIRLLSTDETLIGISGDIDDSIRLESQLHRAGLFSGILNPINLPANFVGYDGITLLLLAAPDLDRFKPDQERAILEWVRAGGSLLFIPGTTHLSGKSALLDALPCEIGENQAISLPTSSSTTHPSALNGRALSARPGATSIILFDQTGYECRYGFGKIVVYPTDIAPLDFGSDKSANTFWRSLLAGTVNVPALEEATENPVNDEDESNVVSGPNAADSVGRGPRETVAIRHVLEFLNATGSVTKVDWPVAMLWLIGIFALIGPLDSILLMRLGQPPRNWITLVGWIGLMICLGGYAIARPANVTPTMRGFRLLDQLNDATIGATDILGVNSERASNVPMSLDQNEWWEPANQAARSFFADRFVDAICREDQKGCRPTSIELTGREAQAWHGEAALTRPGLLKAALSIRHDQAGNETLVGKLSNDSDVPMTDIQIATISGNVRITQSIASRATVDVNERITRDPIAFKGLTEDAQDICPKRTDRIEQLMKSGFACIYCQMPDTRYATEVDPMKAHEQYWQLLRATVELGK